jgi:hypothetical protein
MHDMLRIYGVYDSLVFRVEGSDIFVKLFLTSQIVAHRWPKLYPLSPVYLIFKLEIKICKPTYLIFNLTYS